MRTTGGLWTVASIILVTLVWLAAGDRPAAPPQAEASPSDESAASDEADIGDPDAITQLESGLILGIRDYFRKQGIPPGAVVGVHPEGTRNKGDDPYTLLRAQPVREWSEPLPETPDYQDRLEALGSLLSGGQQQRLTIARALSQDPELLLLDEFSIAVDPVTTMRIEEVLRELKAEVTIIMVTNLVQQARRLADRTAFFLNGELVEVGVTEDLFTGPVKDQRTRDYLEGRFG